MRLAFISTILNFPWGGADTLWTRAAEAARDRGDELLISVSSTVAQAPRVGALISRHGVLHTRPVPAAPPTALPQRILARLRREFSASQDGVVAQLSAFRPDLVIVSCGGTYDLLMRPDWVAWFAATRTRVRIIANWQQENPTLKTSDWRAAKTALRLADQIFFVSQRNLEVTRRHLLEPLPQARVVHNPLRWQQDDLAPWPSSGSDQIATVSRLDDGKGIHLLLHALATLNPLPSVHLNIYGHGPAESYLRATVDHLGLGSRVSFHGYVDSLRQIWGRNQLMISPALEDGVPMTIPEAMLSARPVLATTVGGASDWLTDNQTGFLCPAPNVTLLSETLARALAARERWEEMGRAAAHAANTMYRPSDYLHLIAP